MSFATDVGVIRLGIKPTIGGLVAVQDGRQPRDFGLRCATTG